MPVHNRRAHELDPKIRDQVTYIISEFEAHDIPIDYVTVDRHRDDQYAAGVKYMYAKDQLLVREHQLSDVVDLLKTDFRLRPRYRQRKALAGNIVQVDLVPARSADDSQAPAQQPPDVEDECAAAGHVHDEGEQPCVLNILAAIDRRFGLGVATPNQVVTVCNGDMGPCPATEPEEVPQNATPNPPQCSGNGGNEVRIWIADTGLLDGATQIHSWLNGVDGDPDNRPWKGGFIPVYTGHGTFVAGVVRCIAPTAEIYVANVFNIAGSALEADFVPKLDEALGYGADIVHLTISTLTRNNIPLQSVEAWLQTLNQVCPGAVCVVAAGNDDTESVSWPAALTTVEPKGTVVSVGALTANGSRKANFSNFSNYGGWVTVYAPGQDIVNAYAVGTYKCRWAPNRGKIRHFHGLAKWSGTSFSTPIVTGLIAAEMASSGETGQVAAQAVLAKATTQEITGTVTGQVLLPSCG